MQEIHSIGGGRFFGGGGDRRLRPHQNHQALKCPRCDSLNTKFCYYNNYNLSQPRHFCKSCRRYWTKGGVLRNVPVGGGCRKSKRSRPKNASSETTATTVPPAQLQLAEQELKSSSHSSSESSSPTATAATTEAFSAPSSTGASNNKLGIQESKFLLNQSTNPGLETGALEPGGDCGIFSDIGNFASLINTTNEALPFGFGNISDMSPFPFSVQQGNDRVQQSQWQHQPKGMSMGDNQELKLPELMAGSLLDQTVLVDFSSLQNKGNGGDFGSLDWQGSSDQGLFDLPNTVDHTYWGQSQWTDQDNQSLYLP